MGALAPSFNDMGALLVDLTNHGETGRAATTALGTAFTGLLTPIGKLTPAQALVADNQKKLGLSFETSQGQLVPVASIIAQVGPLIKGMGTAQATAMLQSIGFGSASAKLVSTIQAGPAVFLADEAAVTKAGSAHDAAAKQSQTLAVEFKTLKSAAEDWMTELGERLIPVLSELLGWVEKIVAGFVADWPKIQASIVAVWNAVSPSLDLLWQAISKVFTFVVNNKPVLIGVLSAIAAAVVTYTAVQVVQFGIQVEKWIATTAVAVEKAAVTVAAWLYMQVTAETSTAKTVIAFAAQAAGWVASAAKAVVGAAVQVAAWVGVAAAAAAAFVAENIASLGIIAAVTAIAAAAYELYKHWSEVWGDIKAAALAAWHFIDNDVLKPIENAFSNLIGWFKNNWVALIFLGPFVMFKKQILGFLEDAWHSITGGFSTVIEWVKKNWVALVFLGPFMVFKTQIVGLLKDVVGLFGNFRSDVAAVWNHMNADVQQLMGDVVHWFTGLPGRILTGLGNLLSLLVHTGEDLIQGLVNGIEGFAGHVVNAVKHVVSSACHEFESGFGLWSPSHVTAGYGQQIDQGLANGITDNTGLVVNAAAVMSSGLRTTLVDGVSAAYAAAAVSAQAGNVTLAGIIESGKKGSQGLATAPAALANPFADIPAALAKLAAMGNAAITKIGNATAAAPIGGGSSGGGGGGG